MTDNDKLELILSEIREMKGDIRTFSERLDRLEQKVDCLDQKVDRLGQRVADINLHLENVTDRNIQILAENFIDLTRKLDQAIPVADKNLAYEVKVSYLAVELDKLKEEVAAIKTSIA